MSVGLLASSNPLNHVVQHPILEPGGFTLLSNHIIMQLIAAVILIIFLPRFVRLRAGNDEVGRLVPKGWGNALEGLCDALRTHVARPALGEHTDRFIPYIWSAFFFILTCNVLGMIPLGSWTPFLGGGHVLGGTSTGNIWVTATLAVCTLFMIVYNGLHIHGMKFVSHFFMGPPGLNVFIAFLEVVGLVAKTFALAVRLFANMVAGHVMLAVIIGFVSAAAAASGTWAAVGVSIPVIIGAVALNFLELFVAFLQAFIFTFLSAMFIGQAVSIHHDHDTEEHPAVEAVGH
ncbi:MAG: F0F1 ATP synthase subunit A [Planctomycetota bacterium]